MSTNDPIPDDQVRATSAAATGDAVPAAAVTEPIYRDRVRWSPTLAGLTTAITTLVVLTILGLAIGISAFEPGDAGVRDVDTGAAAWGIISAILAFFLGGWVAGRNAISIGDDNGALHGFLAGAATVVVMLFMIGVGVGNLLGLAGANIDNIAALSTGVMGQTAAPPQDIYDAAQDGAWGTLIGLVLALGASTAGGVLGHPDTTVMAERPRVRRPAPAAR